MDEQCQNCSELCRTRTQVVHGYGDVGADFCFIGLIPDAGADSTAIPLISTDPSTVPTDSSMAETGQSANSNADIRDGSNVPPLRSVLEEIELCDSESPLDSPVLENAFLTYLTRCRHPERGPSDQEIATCDPFVTAEIRSINPEILVPIGQRSLRVIAAEYTTKRAADLDIATAHGTSIRGRGFELVPMADPNQLSRAQLTDWIDHFVDLTTGDYRQTKGRQGR